jgi:hypothetical protein
VDAGEVATSGASQTTTDSVTNTNSATRGNAVANSSGTDTTVTFTNSVSTTVNPSTTFDTSFSFSQQQSLDNSQTLTEDRSLAQSESLTASGGFLKVVGVIHNTSNLAFQVTNLSLSATFQAGPAILALGNLDIDEGPFTTFVPFMLSPRESTGPINFVSLVLTLGELQGLLANANALVITLSLYQLSDATGKPFAFNVTDVGSRTTLLAIDYGPMRPPEVYQVATNFNPGHLGVTAAMIFREILRIPFSASGETGLTSVRDVGARSSSAGQFRWLVAHTHAEGPDVITTPYGLRSTPYDFNSIEVFAGDILQVALVGPGSPAPAEEGGADPSLATGPALVDGGQHPIGTSLDAALQVATPSMDASLPWPQLPPDAGPQVSTPSMDASPPVPQQPPGPGPQGTGP